MTLHHGRPVQPVVSALHGRSCGVGFLSRRGLAMAPSLPVGAAWRRLHAMSRLHAVRLSPRLGLPKGLLLLSVYCPLRQHDQRSERAAFDLAMMEFVHTLDMQVPTLLMGDFNGSLTPAQDYQSISGARRAACPLLAHLLGPGLRGWMSSRRSCRSRCHGRTKQPAHKGRCQLPASISSWPTILPWHWCRQLLSRRQYGMEVTLPSGWL